MLFAPCCASFRVMFHSFRALALAFILPSTFHHSILPVFCWRCHVDLRETAADSSVFLFPPLFFSFWVQPGITVKEHSGQSSHAQYRCKKYTILTGEHVFGVPCWLIGGLMMFCWILWLISCSGRLQGVATWVSRVFYRYDLWFVQYLKYKQESWRFSRQH